MFDKNKIYLKYNIRDKINNYYDKSIISLSAVKWEEIFQYFLDKYVKKVNTIVEIGTNYGISTVLLSKYAEKVYTFDIEDFAVKKEIFEMFGVKNVIFYKIKNDKEKEEILKNLKFQFAFIDGNHFEIPTDYKLLNHCGKILFHDYETGWIKENFRTSVVRYINTLIKDVKEIVEPFAYLENLKC